MSTDMTSRAAMIERVLESVEANRLDLRNVASVLECAKAAADGTPQALRITGAISVVLEKLDRIDEELTEGALLKNAGA
jgi:hypothetical protein